MKLTGIVLKEVKIKGKKIIPGSANRNGPGNADLVFDEEDIKESSTTNLYELLKQKLPGFRVVYDRGFPTAKLNNHMVVIHIDGGGLPLQMDIPLTVDNLVDELNTFQVVQFKGMEVMYSEKNMTRYLYPRINWINHPWIGSEREKIPLSEDTLRRGDGDLLIPWYYRSEYKPGYLEQRVNLITNSPPDVATIEITTKNGNGWYRNRAPSVVTYRPLPVMRPLQFYRPKYSLAPGAVIEPDYRATLHWEPNINTDANGRARVSFYTSDIAGKYTITVSGVDATGGIGDSQIKINK
jgi:hypothetical protein